MTQNNFSDLPHKDRILLAVEINGDIVSPDAQLVLENRSLDYVSKILRKMYVRGYLKRKKEPQPYGKGTRYRYELDTKGIQRLKWLHAQGY